MYKNTILLFVFFCAFWAVVSRVETQELYWTDGDPCNHLWNSPNNWDLGRVPGYMDVAYIDFIEGKSGPTINTDAPVWEVAIGQAGNGSGTLTMTAGALYGGGYFAVAAGEGKTWTIDMSGGTMRFNERFYLGGGEGVPGS